MFSDLTGLSEKAISNVIKGRTKFPKYDFFQAIAQHFPNVNLRWLIIGEGEMHFNSEDESTIVDQVKEPDTFYHTKDASIERLTKIIEQMMAQVNEVPALKEKINILQKQLEETKKG